MTWRYGDRFSVHLFGDRSRIISSLDDAFAVARLAQPSQRSASMDRPVDVDLRP